MVNRLMILIALTPLWWWGAAAVACAQSGEEEFQRKMNELRRAGNQSKPSRDNESRPRDSRVAEESSGSAAVPNISASPGTCQRQYDRFRDTTTLNMTVGTIYKSEDSSSRRANRSLESGTNDGGGGAAREELRLALAASTGGRQESAAPRQVVWLLQSTAGRYRYHNEAEVLMIIDGERIKVGKADAMGAFPVRGEVLERLKMHTPADLFLRVARGREVEVQIGPNEFRLEAVTLSALRDFAACANLK